MGSQSHPSSSRDRMKAQVFLPSLLLVLHSCRSHVLHKRSLLGESHIDPSGHHGGHHGHHDNHIPHHGDEHGIVHARTLGDLEGGNLVSSPPVDSYLPSADYQDEESLDNGNNSNPDNEVNESFADKINIVDSVPQQEDEDYSNPNALDSKTENVDNNISKSEDEVGSNTRTEETDNSNPILEEGNDSVPTSLDEDEENGSQECPGSSLEACVKACPGTTTRVYGVCVE